MRSRGWGGSGSSSGLSEKLGRPSSVQTRRNAYLQPSSGAWVRCASNRWRSPASTRPGAADFEPCQSLLGLLGVSRFQRGTRLEHQRRGASSRRGPDGFREPCPGREEAGENEDASEHPEHEPEAAQPPKHLANRGVRRHRRIRHRMALHCTSCKDEDAMQLRVPGRAALLYFAVAGLLLADMHRSHGGREHPTLHVPVHKCGAPRWPWGRGLEGRSGRHPAGQAFAPVLRGPRSVRSRSVYPRLLNSRSSTSLPHSKLPPWPRMGPLATSSSSGSPLRSPAMNSGRRWRAS